MIELETTINAVLEHLKPELASETWISRRRYFNQMLKCAKSLGITEPGPELYCAFIADDNGSDERHELHVHCVKLIDSYAGTQAKNEFGVLFNPPPLPTEEDVRAFFSNREFPIAGSVNVDYLIVKSELEMRYLNQTESTIGQYKHSWMDIRRYFYDAVIPVVYDEALMNSYLRENDVLRDNGSIKQWKWKINRKAAYVLMEVANTGHFQWSKINPNSSSESKDIESIRFQYLEWLKQRNLSQSTVDLHDYVFRKTAEFAAVETRECLQFLSHEKIQLVISKFVSVCNRRSISTILPILRSLLSFLYTASLADKDLSGIVLSSFVQRGSVAAYISEKDQAELIVQLDKESKRTKVIILLVMRLGLRNCDICNLTFQEVDWRNDQIKLSQKKTGEPLILPLLPDVGNALMDYILNERPKRDDHYPYIFLRKQAPYNRLTTIYHICSGLLARLGVKPVNGTATGAHLFRYSMVHKLLAAKVPHQVITDVLGHSSKESDKPYLSMEESMLRMCALDLSVIGSVSWSGGTING
jgi:integrase